MLSISSIILAALAYPSFRRRCNNDVEACPANVKDATGAGDLYAAGFLYAHALGMPLDVCGKVGSITAGKVVEVIGPKIDIPRWKAAKRDIRALIAENL